MDLLLQSLLLFLTDSYGRRCRVVASLRNLAEQDCLWFRSNPLRFVCWYVLKFIILLAKSFF